MAVTIGPAGLTFNDSTIQTTSAGHKHTRYTSPASWTKDSRLKGVFVTILSAGGGGAGVTAASGPEVPPNILGGGGGSGGSVFRAYIPAPLIPGPLTISVGTGGNGGPAPGVAGAYGAGQTGGTSSFGPLISITGGGGSPATAGGSAGAITYAAPISPIHNFGRAGQGGGTATPNVGGFGGSHTCVYPFAGGSPRAFPAPVAPGLAGEQFCAGGSGGIVQTASPGNATGGAGMPGLVIVEEIY